MIIPWREGMQAKLKEEIFIDDEKKAWETLHQELMSVFRSYSYKDYLQARLYIKFTKTLFDQRKNITELRDFYEIFLEKPFEKPIAMYLKNFFEKKVEEGTITIPADLIGCYFSNISYFLEDDSELIDQYLRYSVAYGFEYEKLEIVFKDQLNNKIQSYISDILSIEAPYFPSHFLSKGGYEQKLRKIFTVLDGDIKAALNLIKKLRSVTGHHIINEVLIFLNDYLSSEIKANFAVPSVQDAFVFMQKNNSRIRIADAVYEKTELLMILRSQDRDLSLKVQKFFDSLLNKRIRRDLKRQYSTSELASYQEILFKLQTYSLEEQIALKKKIAEKAVQQDWKGIDEDLAIYIENKIIAYYHIEHVKEVHNLLKTDTKGKRLQTQSALLTLIEESYTDGLFTKWYFDLHLSSLCKQMHVDKFQLEDDPTLDQEIPADSQQLLNSQVPILKSEDYNCDELLDTLSGWFLTTIPNISASKQDSASAELEFIIKMAQKKAEDGSLSSYEKSDLKNFLESFVRAVKTPTIGCKNDCIRRAEYTIGRYNWGKVIGGSILIVLGLVTIAAAPVVTLITSLSTFGLFAPAGLGTLAGGFALVGCGSYFLSEGLDKTPEINNLMNALENSKII
jgi:hypothetical protein